MSSADNLGKQFDQHFVGSQFDTDVNNKGADQTVARREFCRLLITLANRWDPDQDQQCRPKQFDTDVNNKELDQTVRIVFFINSKKCFLKLRFIL